MLLERGLNAEEVTGFFAVAPLGEHAAYEVPMT